ncbi:zf-HC2 domain-containing protein [Hoyosella sp. YIM 151337]|nr:zf-HC2 domain-containing protein [Hoyosella sp. YIM 151337]MCW4355866.1 zf-HC2 domain-containing protein [Hoyosella sp. YIM 151337]
MLTCRWSARRMQRYLDRDPAAMLTTAEARLLEVHLTDCARCRDKLESYQFLSCVLRSLAESTLPEEETLRRMHRTLSCLTRGDCGSDGLGS